MYSGIEFPLGREQAARSPACPGDSRRLPPAGARQRAEDHCAPKIVDPAPPGTPASASPASPLSSTMPGPENPASWLDPGRWCRRAEYARSAAEPRVEGRAATHTYASLLDPHRGDPREQETVCRARRAAEAPTSRPELKDLVCLWRGRPAWSLGPAEGVVDLAGDVALQAADDLFLGRALGGPPGRVGLGAWVVGQAGHGDRPQRGVGLPVAARLSRWRSCLPEE